MSVQRENVVSILLPAILAMATLMSAAAQAEEIPGDLGERFVRAMQLGEQSALGLRMLADTLRKDGKINDLQAACLKQVKSADFTAVMKQIAVAQLTAGEMQEAVRFFESSAGQKYLQMSAVESAKMGGVTPESAMPDFTREEYDATNEFGTTKLYQKLVNEAVMTRSAVARPLIQAATVKIVQRCAPQ